MSMISYSSNENTHFASERFPGQKKTVNVRAIQPVTNDSPDPLAFPECWTGSGTLQAASRLPFP